MDDGIRFIGLDVHKRQTVVAIADSGRDGEVRACAIKPRGARL